MKMTVREYIDVFFKKCLCDYIRLYDYDGGGWKTDFEGFNVKPEED